MKGFQERTLNEKEGLFKRLEEDLVLLRSEKEQVTIDLTRKVSEFDNLKIKLSENKQEVENLQEKFAKEFKLLANEILESNSSKITKQNKENLESILNPLQEKIKTFERKVDDTHKDSIRQSSALKQQLEELAKNNLKISQEAINLTKALKGDSKTQGNWGELVLERVLEKSGLLSKIRALYNTRDSKSSSTLTSTVMDCGRFFGTQVTSIS